jgi:hypothetical protein
MEPFIYTVPLQDILDECRAEVLMRKKVYWRRVHNGQLSAENAARKIAAMQGACDALEFMMRQQGIEPLYEPRDRVQGGLFR